ncbi:MAG TPA: hypothetical protein VF720_16985, partial [Candidatus Eisenbacteria bacterium]
MHTSPNVKVVTGRPQSNWGDAVAVPVFKGRGAVRGTLFTALDKQLKGALTDALALSDFNGGEDVKTVYKRSKALPPRVLL